MKIRNIWIKLINLFKKREVTSLDILHEKACDILLEYGNGPEYVHITIDISKHPTRDYKEFNIRIYWHGCSDAIIDTSVDKAFKRMREALDPNKSTPEAPEVFIDANL